jgi:hypothetical protein
MENELNASYNHHHQPSPVEPLVEPALFVQKSL